MQATAKAAIATQTWARTSRRTVRSAAAAALRRRGAAGAGSAIVATGRPPLRVGPELLRRDHLDGGDHLAVPEAAIFVAGHQQVAGPGEAGMDLRDIAGDDHRVDVGAGDEDAVDDVRRGKAQGDVAVGGQD